MSTATPTGAPPPEEDEEAEEEEETDPIVKAGLDASSAVFERARALLKSSQSETLAVRRADAKAIRKEALAMNRAFCQYVKRCHERENRLLVELHLVRQAAYRDGVNRDAHRARVYEFLRRYRIDDPTTSASGATTTIASCNPLHAPTAAASQVDRAMSTAARIEAAIAQLSPTGTVKTHGASLLTAVEGLSG